MSYRALLIGAADYEAPGITALPFVPGDLERLGEALVARGFHEAKVAQSPWFTTNVINGEVSRFLASAASGDRLLVVLSGHGVHHDGQDYLVPEDIRPELHTFAEGCVALDWRRELEDSTAAQVVFLIDACREGIRHDTKATAAWSRRKVADALRRKVAYVYACSQAEVARFVRDTDEVRDGHDVGIEPGASFSLFSRALADRIGSLTDLADLRREVQQRVDELHAAYGKSGSPQRLRVLTEEPEAGFCVFPPVERAAPELPSGPERVWAEAVTTHLAWTYTKTDIPELRAACGALAASYARDCRTDDAMRQDPWYDDELAERTTDRLGFLLQRLAPGTVLSPTEAALLAVLPFAAQAHRVRQAAARDDVPQAELGAFLDLFPRLGRRLRGLTDTQAGAVRDIHWWGYHRWLARQPDAYTAVEDRAPVGTGWIREELGTSRLLRHLKEQRIAPASAPGTVRSTELAEEREVAPSTVYEHTVRERLVSGLFKAAHALAVDPADLPEVLVEHLGISDSVSLPELLTTVRQSSWAASGPGRSLTALCGHPAVELALKRHAESVDVLLRSLHDGAARTGSSLAPLAGLPAYADARRVRPSGSAPANLSTGIRFRLADDRVQELLMGEQLYGDRGLAVRELYQNALDACRYREARTEYLRRTGTATAPWEGEIVFGEGTDDAGRPYLECADNGIGMGVTELQRAFSQGGARFVDLPEFAEEGAQWASLDPPVDFMPVSRFGIGVLSYFMIADELVLWTCRLGRDGRPGRLLKVTIAGPGTLFRV
ncbi:caspase family protein, partial [Streptomyces boluensis]